MEAVAPEPQELALAEVANEQTSLHLAEVVEQQISAAEETDRVAALAPFGRREHDPTCLIS